ncbi:hypothetical protein EK21DRAFT_102284 [Setomelanomma holmii]|uniref:Glycosyl transferase CAP10 domain-containing protein n=1 Tax=Setomelanomma holmii TaxID=210430 RepID=A0A9P4H5C6_9PLEO|nr:hypothetical protein EK21DRAFT_102284 [Setomelanomma holmii]
MNISTFWRTLWYLGLLAALTLATILYTLNWSHGVALKEHGLGHVLQPWRSSGKHGDSSESSPAGHEDELPLGLHPITHLMDLATSSFDKMMKNKINTLDQAAAMYRKKRGRHPPPGFDAWYAYAMSHNALVVEDFWDQIYEDLGPFWSLDPVVLRKQTHVLRPVVEVRSGQVDLKSHSHSSKDGTLVDMIGEMVQDPNVTVPDMDIPIRTVSSPAMLVPWETIDTAFSMSRKIMLEPKDIINRYSGLDDIESLTADYDWKPTWLGPRLTHPDSWLGPRPLWSVLRPACHPGSPTRRGKVYNDIWSTKGEGTLQGYVKNWTSTVDACQHPNLQGLHAQLLSPTDMAISTALFPLFAESKMIVGNEILIPSSADWNISAPSIPLGWESRSDTLQFRAGSTSAHDSAHYWRRFQRERLVSMLNATRVETAEASIHSGNESTLRVGYADNFRLLPANDYRIKAQTGGQLAEWVNEWADTAFTHLACREQEGGCGDMEDYFSVTAAVSSEEADRSKYAISVDDESLLHNFQSNKVTLRSSIHRQWYDSRLVPWLHFIPLDHTFIDLYGIMEYFLGTRRIAEASKVWADTVLRKEDMLIYTYRLLLEYARVLDDKRERMGWVGDLH